MLTWPYRRAAIITLTSDNGRGWRQRPVSRQCQGHHWYLNAKCTLDALIQTLGQALGHHQTVSCIDCLGCEQRLTVREREILLTLGRGLSPTQVARLLFISEKTISSHKRSAMRKLGFRRPHELYQWIRHELDDEKRVHRDPLI